MVSSILKKFVVILSFSSIVILMIPVLLLHLHVYYPEFIYGFDNVSSKRPTDYGLSYTDISVKTSDNLNLAGWQIPSDNAKGAVIMAHGTSANKGKYLKAATYFHNGGYDVYMVDLRGHGDSDEEKITYGLNEKKDIQAVINYIKSHKKEKIALYGHSMGAAVVMMSAAANPDIDVIIFDSGFLSAEKILAYRMSLLPTFIVNPLGKIAKAYAKMFYGINLEDVAPVKALKQVNVPILFIVSEKDRNIPPENGKILYSLAQQDKELFVIKDFGHDNTADDPHFAHTVVSFLDKHLN